MRRMLFSTLLVVLALTAASVQAGQGGQCSPEGTWYGYNSEDALWIVTITRSGPKSFTTVMDVGTYPPIPTIAASTDWRGEFVKTGPGEYDWTTMAYYRGDETSSIPYYLGFCPLSAQLIDCDSWWGSGACQIYGFFTPDQDPFEEGFLLQTNDPLEAFFQRMPMTYPSQ